MVEGGALYQHASQHNGFSLVSRMYLLLVGGSLLHVHKRQLSANSKCTFVDLGAVSLLPQKEYPPAIHSGAQAAESHPTLQYVHKDMELYSRQFTTWICQQFYDS